MPMEPWPAASIPAQERAELVPGLAARWEGDRLLPLSATGFVLDQSPTATGTWSQVSFPYTTNATDISISEPSPTGSKF